MSLTTPMSNTDHAQEAEWKEIAAAAGITGGIAWRKASYVYTTFVESKLGKGALAKSKTRKKTKGTEPCSANAARV